jgi:hypothetical protein
MSFGVSRLNSRVNALTIIGVLKRVSRSRSAGNDDAD